MKKDMYNKNERLNRIRNSLKKIGYTEEYQEENYPFTSGNLALKADIVTLTIQLSMTFQHLIFLLY